MPLRILKRNSKQYNVVSKSTFVISVELLDNGLMECTLDADSTGRDCLCNISQRLGLHQPELFGLRYISRGVPPRVRWVELDRPLRKQLEKYAQDLQLFLGVMFYVTDVNYLKDEMSRYHYFLQLKSDVIEGKLNCSVDQAISLAAYSLQAEFGDFDPERHTVEYLKDFAILPKELTSEQKFTQMSIDILYEAVVRQYASLVGFPPPLAEIYYIMVAQQLDGYGQEAYPSKDDKGNDILICVGTSGLIIRRRDWTHIAAFRWNDIKSLLGHKRLFVVECAQSHRTMQYHFADPEVAKYVRKMCTLQSAFYKDNLLENSQTTDAQPNFVQQQPRNLNISARNINANVSNNGPSSYVLQAAGDVVDTQGNSYFSSTGVTPDLIVPTLCSGESQSTASSSFLLNTSSLNNSGFSHQSSSSGLMHRPGFTPPQFGFAHPLQQLPFPIRTQTFDPFTFQNHGELSHLQQHISTVPPNSMSGMPLNQPMNVQQSELNEPEYSNGYNRAISEYTAAVQEKYGNILPLSMSKDSSFYFTRQLEQPTSSGQAGGSVDDEPIYQNEIVSQMHSMEIRDSSASKSDLNGNAGSSITSQSSSNGNSEFVNARGMMNRIQVRQEAPKDENFPSSSSGQALMQNHQLTINHPPVLMDSTPVYVFKPPPPYPGHQIRLAQMNADKAESQTPSETSGSSSSLQRSVNGEKSLPISRLSPSATTAIVSAQVHSLPEDSNKEEKLSIKSSSSNNDSNTNPAQNLTAENNPDVKNVVGKRNSIESQGSQPSSRSSSIKITQEKRSQVKSSTSSAETVVTVPTSQKNKAEQKTGIDTAILLEFHAIPQFKHTRNFSTALKKENFKRCRAPDVLPYEDNLIRLTPTRQNPGGYINASPIKMKVGDREWLYVASQIPLTADRASLWQMVWDLEAKVIVSLESDSSAPLYPSQSQKAANMTFNEYQIVESKPDQRRSSSTLSTIGREFNLVYIPKKKQRKVWVLPYEEEWKDDVPVHTEHFLCFLEEVNSMQRKVSDPNSPTVVLCGTGAGRCGIFVLADLLLHAADCGHKIQCSSLLRQLREQRMSLVSTASQYDFVLQTLAKYLAQSRLI